MTGRRGARRVAPRQFERHVDAGERTAHFVAHVVKETTLPLDESFDAFGHLVEHAGERGDLVVRGTDARFDAGLQFAE